MFSSNIECSFKKTHAVVTYKLNFKQLLPMKQKIHKLHVSLPLHFCAILNMLPALIYNSAASSSFEVVLKSRRE